jgi:hypothetical protein
VRPDVLPEDVCLANVVARPTGIDARFMISRFMI